ncbi:phosphatidylinositol 3- and 4-kinase [Ostertagia ostertagi]
MSNPAASHQDLVDAHWYSGVDYSERCRELKYGLALRREKWAEVSYPKKFGSHEESLFSALYVGSRSSSSSEEILQYIENIECETSENDDLPSSSTINNLRDLQVLRPGYKPSEDVLMPCLSILERISGDLSMVEKCRVLIAKGDLNTADHLLHMLLESADTDVSVEVRCLLAELLAYHRNMLDEAIALLRQGIESIGEGSITRESRLRLFSLLHRLAARQLSGIEEHMESRAFRMREDAIREWTRQRSLAAQGPPSHTARRIECELRCEKEAVESVKEKLVASAVDTVTAGLEALKLLSQPFLKQPCQPAEKNDDILRLIFPLINVIFRFDRDKDVVKAFRREYAKPGMVPAVWVHVVSHLMSHCFAKSILAPVVRTMIVKLIIAYPYHVLHTVLMYKFNEISDTRFFKKRQLPENKVEYEMMQGGFVGLFQSGWFAKRVPLPIVDQKLGTACDYSGQDIVMWGEMERNEDVRQDSLVEQLFSVVNGILNRGEPSAFLRTYKVVPLDSKCGIIEFCQGTVSLKELLCGMDLVSGLHAKEEPGDRKALQVRTTLKDAAKTQVNEASKMFREACALFKPVFRHFFYERHSTVQSWTQMIDNYRRSLAQWSIVTYVVGLGDRHLSNVLFETDTCKLVHIDLGMILEYSKRTLPIPERVPFRLTRDLLDPILIEGTDGRLGESAVRAMRLLRESKHVILGLASVLLRETISNFEEVESNGGERPSFVSETAIARLRDKLNGTDDTFGVQDVEDQVSSILVERVRNFYYPTLQRGSIY